MAAKGLGSNNLSIACGLEPLGSPSLGFHFGHNSTLLEYVFLRSETGKSDNGHPKFDSPDPKQIRDKTVVPPDLKCRAYTPG